MSEDTVNLVDDSDNGAYDTAYTTPYYCDPTIGDETPTCHTPSEYSVQDGQDMFSNEPPAMPTTVEMESPVTSNEINRQAEEMPKTYILHNILVLIFCSLICGILGLVQGSKVSALYRSGDHEAAQEASQSARNWSEYGWNFGLKAKSFIFVFMGLFYLTYLKSP